MLVLLKKLIMILLFFVCSLSYSFEMKILNENNLEKLETIFNNTELSKHDIYLFINHLVYLGRENPAAYALLGKLYNENKLYKDGMYKLSDSERAHRANLMFAASEGTIKDVFVLKKFESETVSLNSDPKKGKQVKNIVKQENIFTNYIKTFNNYYKNIIFDIGNINILHIISFIGIIGIIGIILSCCEHFYLFENTADVVVTAAFPITTIIFFIIYETIKNTAFFWILPGVIILLFILSIVYAIKLNPDKKWAVIFVIPGKILLSISGIIAVVASIGKLVEVFQNKKDRGINTIVFLLFAGISVIIYKIIDKTKKY